ncbi:bifunctional DNA primase/polymerase [Streptomyces sp. NPDC058613]|uniref:bifunctional DNA primase/polymerase n=1 Tax=Streptomyces sp. NPDC058613 TaxID=3346556 RepID=UPI0036480186
MSPLTRTIRVPRDAEKSGTAPAERVRPLDVALWCASQNWPVHPLAPGRKTPPANCATCRPQAHPVRECLCIERGGWCHGFHAATTKRARLSTWWEAQPAFGVGISCGPADLVVLDVDAHSAEVPSRSRLLPGIGIPEEVDLAGLASGFDTLALLAAFRQQTNPAEDDTTLRVKTPSGGLHVWYQALTSAERYRSSTGSSPKVALAWQVDVRATNGYIVAPATRTHAGTYTPVGAARLPAPLPEWLAAELQRTGHAISATPAVRPPIPPPRRTGKTDSNTAHRLLAPLLAEVEGCAAATHGTSFTEKLNRAAYTAGGLVAAGHLSTHQACALLKAAADGARPHQSQRSLTVITSALSAGLSRPLHVKGRP